MHEALYRLIHVHYTEILSALSLALLLIGLYLAVRIDPYLQKRQRRSMLIVCALVFSPIAQNEPDYLLTAGQPMILLRRAVDIYGYSVRPVILPLFLYIVSPQKGCRLCRVLIGITAGLHPAALFADICFTIDADNMFQRGWPVLHRWWRLYLWKPVAALAAIVFLVSSLIGPAASLFSVLLMEEYYFAAKGRPLSEKDIPKLYELSPLDGDGAAQSAAVITAPVATAITPRSSPRLWSAVPCRAGGRIPASTRGITFESVLKSERHLRPAW